MDYIDTYCDDVSCRGDVSGKTAYWSRISFAEAKASDRWCQFEVNSCSLKIFLCLCNANARALGINVHKSTEEAHGNRFASQLDRFLKMQD